MAEKSLPKSLAELAANLHEATQPAHRRDNAAKVREDRQPEPARETLEPSAVVDVIVICAMKDPELDKVAAALSPDWEQRPAEPTDPNRYFRALLKTRRKKSLNIIAAAPNDMGMTASAVLTTKMILRFRPRLVAMIGIAGGVGGAGVNFGDILIPDQTVDYGTGKVTKEKSKVIFKPNPKPLPLDPKLLSHLRNRNNDDHCHDIRKAWPGEQPTTALRVHFGTFGTNDLVIDDAKTLDSINRQWRKLVAVEMETHAVHRACHETLSPPCKFLAVKSASDLAAQKTDKWRPYAAFTAARFFVELLSSDWEDFHLS